jgi:putative acetyltransferase
MILSASDSKALDYDALAALWVASWQETMPGIDFAARRAWILSRLQVWPKDQTLLAQTAEKSEGFLLLDVEAGLIDQIVVAPAAKGTGIAGSLLHTARSRVAAAVVLVVNADNPRAIRFYEREGFRREAEGINPMSGLPTWRMVAPRFIPPPSEP